MIRLLTAILIVCAHTSWGTLAIVDQQDEISSEKFIKYEKNTLYLENKTPLTKEQVNAVIFPADDRNFTPITPISDSEIEKQLTHLKVTPESPVILKQTTTIEYLANGRSKETTSLIIKQTRQNFSPTFLKYNPMNSDLKVTKVRHYPQGKTIKKMDPNCIKTIRLASSNHRVEVYPEVPFTPGLSLIYIEYELIHAFPKPYIDSIFNLLAQETALTIIVPNQQTLHFSAAFGNPMIKPFKNGASTAYSWTISTTPKQPKVLYFTSYSKWDVLVHKYQNLLQYKITDPTLFDQLITKVIPENASDLNKVKLIYNWIQSNITLTMDQLITTPENTLENKKGNYQARTILLSALLHHIGIKNELNLVIPKGLPIVSDHFTNILCQINIQDEAYYLALKNRFSRFPALAPELKDRLLLNLTTGKIKKLITSSSQFQSTNEISLSVELKEDHAISSKVNIKMQGTIESDTRAIIAQKYVLFSELFGKKTQITPESQTNITQVDALDLSQPLSYQSTYLRKNQWIQLEDKILIFIPELKCFVNSTPSLTNFHIFITLPEGYRLTPQNQLSVDDDKKQILYKQLTTTSETATLEIKVNTFDISNDQKSLIINELKKAIVLEKINAPL